MTTHSEVVIEKEYLDPARIGQAVLGRAFQDIELPENCDEHNLDSAVVLSGDGFEWLFSASPHVGGFVWWCTAMNKKPCVVRANYLATLTEKDTPWTRQAAVRIAKYIVETAAKQ